MSANLYEWLTSQLLNQLNKLSLLLTLLGYAICAGWRFRNWLPTESFYCLKEAPRCLKKLSSKVAARKPANRLTPNPSKTLERISIDLMGLMIIVNFADLPMRLHLMDAKREEIGMSVIKNPKRGLRLRIDGV